jgi:hypothetical protein
MNTARKLHSNNNKHKRNMGSTMLRTALATAAEIALLAGFGTAVGT